MFLLCILFFKYIFVKLLKLLTKLSLFFLGVERFILIYDPLNVTLHEANKNDLLLSPNDRLLMKELLDELMLFRLITIMLSTNTQYSFNEYLPMVDGIKRQLHRQVDQAKSSKTMIDFIKQMKLHFDTFVLLDKVKTLAWTACLLDPKHINRFRFCYVLILVDNVVDLLSAITPPESQDTVDPSQPPVNVSVKIPKSDRSKEKACDLSKYFDPAQGWAGDEMDGEEEVTRPESKTVRDTVLIEVDNLRTQLLNNKDSLMESHKGHL